MASTVGIDTELSIKADRTKDSWLLRLRSVTCAVLEIFSEIQIMDADRSPYCTVRDNLRTNFVPSSSSVRMLTVVDILLPSIQNL